MTTIKDHLLSLGMQENEFDNHESDLYVLKNDISSKWLETYEFKQNVTTFRSEIDNELWYEVPFGYMKEYHANKFNV